MPTDHQDGQFGAADVPENCPDCGDQWSSGERVRTGDDRGIGGWEDWLYCESCGCEMFFPVVHRPPLSNTGVER
jgi:hypothetical protein